MLILVVRYSFTTTQITGEELKENNEEEKQITKLSNEDLVRLKDEYEGKLHDFLNSFPDTYTGVFYSSDITHFEYYLENKDFQKFVNMLFSIGYGIEQAEGYYYLYVGEPVGYTDGEIDTIYCHIKTIPPLEYKFNKEYRFDMEGRETVDTFFVDTDSLNYFDVIVNGEKYSLSSHFLPELIYFTYRLTEFGDSGRHVFTFFIAVPPSGSEVVFYEYSISSGLEKIGTVYIDDYSNLFYAHIKDLTYNSVSINNQVHKFDRSKLPVNGY